MAFLVKTANDILSQALRKLALNTTLTATGPGSVVRALTEVVTTELADFYNILDFNMSLQTVSTSQGRALDLLGNLYNVQRKSLSTLSTIDKSLGTFYFYLDSPAPSDVIIPSGIRIFTNAADFVGNTFTYQTTSPCVISAGRLRAFATIQPLFADSIYTAGVGTLVGHNFVSPNPGIIVKCTNIKPVSPQVAFEDDDNYRARIIKSVRTAAGGTADSLRFAGLGVQGIRDITVRESAFGLGSYEVIVVTEDNAINTTIMADLQTALNKIRPVGVRMILRNPDLLPMDVKVSILLRNLSNLDRDGLSRRGKVAILRYLNTMLVGTTMVYSQLIQSILDASELILDVNVLSLTANGEEILRRNFTPNTDQQIIPGEIEVTASV